MSKFLSTLFLTLFLFIPTPAANAQCLLCGVIGFALGSASGDQYGGGGGNVIYVAPRIGERLLVNPLEVRIRSTELLPIWSRRYGGKTIQELFADTVTDSPGYIVLEVVRVVDPSANGNGSFWFAYIEKEKMKTLSELPPS